MSLGGDGEKPLLGFEEVSPEMSERISAFLPPRGWWRIHHSELAHVRSSVAFDAGMLLPLLSSPPPPIFLSVLVRALRRFSVSDPRKPCLLSRPWCPLTCTRKRWDGYSQTQKTFGVQPVPSTGGLWPLGLCPVVLSHGGCCPSGARWGRGECRCLSAVLRSEGQRE